MRYKARQLRRLWEVEIYMGDPDDPDTPTRTETVIALNGVEANRLAGGRLVKPPKALYFVSWPKETGQPIFRVDRPDIGPIGEPVKPSTKTDQPEI